jgi:hypothetical protein
VEANRLVGQWHRHHRPVVGHRFSIGVENEGRICGAAIVGRPVARMLDDGFTAEVTRCVTDGTKNACSMLYAACWRAWRAMGGTRLITYTLASETGTSLNASGWKALYQTANRPQGWDTPGRPRVPNPQQPKTLWEVSA